MIRSLLTTAVWPVVALTVLAAAVLATWGCQSGGGSDDPLDDRSLATTDIARGDTSGVMERGVRVIRTQAELDALWEEHGRLEYPTASAPPVDFESSMVVAAFMGMCTSGGCWIVIDEVEAVAEDGDEPARIVVRVTETTPAPGDIATMALTAPYDFVIVGQAGGEATLALTKDSDG